MSTKIYNGYRLALREPADALSFPRKVQARLYPVYRDSYTEAVISIATLLHDMPDYYTGISLQQSSPNHAAVSALLPEHPLTSPLLKAASYLDGCLSLQRANPSERIAFDFNCEIVILPPDKQTGNILCLFYAPIRSSLVDYQRPWESLAEVKSYPYWDNTDRPRGISQQRWQERGKEWARVLQDKPPAVMGLSWSLLGDTHPEFVPMLQSLRIDTPDVQYYEYRIVPIERRARKIAQVQLRESEPAGGTPDGRWQARVDKQAAKILPKLRPISMRDLVEPDSNRFIFLLNG